MPELKKINRLADAIKQVLPVTIKNFNEVRLPGLETAWGRPFKDELQFEKQKTVEISKSYARPFNNELYRNIQSVIDGFTENTMEGLDMVFDLLPIEHKNSFSEDSNSFTGNSISKKVPWHLLMKFSTDENGRIQKCFACLVDTSKMSKAWSGGGDKANFTTLKISNEDIDHVVVITGSLKPCTKYAKLILE